MPDEESTTVVFDSWLNLPYAPGEVEPDPTVTARFKREGSAYGGGETLADVVAEMDRLGVDGAVLTRVPRDITPAFIAGMRWSDEAFFGACEQVATGAGAHPGRFVTSVGIDPKLGYHASRQLRRAHEEYGVAAFRIVGMFTGIPINDPLAYPLYTAACDLGVPVTINVGAPGPMKPARNQRTMDIDDVALCFPDLKIVMSHVGDPWVSETISLLQKHPNVYAMTAGWAPKYLPEPLLKLMNRFPHKVMWASDYPVLPIERTITEGRQLEVKPEALQRFLGPNCRSVFG